MTTKATPAPPPPGRSVAAGIVLVDAVSAVRHPHAGPVVRVTLTWAAAEPIREELKISARLVDGAEKAVAQNDGVPVHYTYPTTAWVPGERVLDTYDLALPPGAPKVPIPSSSSSTAPPTGAKSGGSSCPRCSWSADTRAVHLPNIVGVFA